MLDGYAAYFWFALWQSQTCSEPPARDCTKKRLDHTAKTKRWQPWCWQKMDLIWFDQTWRLNKIIFNSFVPWKFVLDRSGSGIKRGTSIPSDCWLSCSITFMTFPYCSIDPCCCLVTDLASSWTFQSPRFALFFVSYITLIDPWFARSRVLCSTGIGKAQNTTTIYSSIYKMNPHGLQWRMKYI